MAEQRPDSPKTVRFNVGGRLFEMAWTLIDQHEGSTLARLVSDTWQEDPTKPVIINRDGDIFAHVLTYLRDESIVLPSKLPKSEFLRDLDFYGIVPAEGTVKTRFDRGPPTEMEVKWASRFDDLVKYKEEHGHCRVPQKQGQLGSWVKTQRERRGELSAKRIALLEGIGFEWSLATHVHVGWDSRFQQLVEYKDEHGHCRVPQKQGQLGSWVMNQRLRRGELSAKRIALLEGIGFEWSLSTHVDWDTRFQQLVKYKKEHGHCRVPRKQGQLGSWVTNQRRRRGELSAKHVALLEGIGFEWSLATHVGWDSRFQQLVKYKDEHGHCRVPRKQGQLGSWVTKQRLRRGELSAKRVGLLDGIGFEWSLSTRVGWDSRFQQLVKYKEEHGHCRVPQKQGQLGSWMIKQRERRGELSAKRVALLEGIGFEWSLAPLGWDSRFQQLVEYKDEHGHCRVPQKQGQLGSWVTKQRLRRGELSAKHIALLEGIGFEWSRAPVDWDTRFQQLVEYKDERGHCRVPQSQGQLGSWVIKQRERRGKLSAKRVALLEGIGFEWSLAPVDWDTRFQQLVEYKEEHGDCRVPRSQEALGTWVNHQRQYYRKGTLPDERVRRLRGIGFEWCIRTQPDWDTRFQQLVKYKDEHGHCRVPQRQETLGTWVSRQRQLYRNGELSDERIRRLEGIGLEWCVRILSDWDTRFQQLVEYKEGHGHCRVPRSHEALCTWVRSQRHLYSKGQLSDERVRRLKGIGFEWSFAPVDWDTHFQQLVEYKVKHGHCKVPFRQGSLGTWVKRQRSEYRRWNLSKERVKLLGSIGFEWSGHALTPEDSD